ISQAFIIFAVVRRLFEEVYKYVSDNYIVAVKISTYLIIFVILYFIVGYVLYSTKRIYKYL
ncbi:MAG: two pore domain potassium channel family protein, partial [Romboutsia timonensis]|nr:two pore domain potassium channel family protein [Romboutsia timonensis]